MKPNTRVWPRVARRMGRTGTAGLVLCGVTVGGWAVLLEAGPSGSSPAAPGTVSGTADLPPAPVRVRAPELSVPDVPVRRLRTAPRATERFSTVGLTWHDP